MWDLKVSTIVTPSLSGRLYFYTSKPQSPVPDAKASSISDVRMKFVAPYDRSVNYI